MLLGINHLGTVQGFPLTCKLKKQNCGKNCFDFCDLYNLQSKAAL